MCVELLTLVYTESTACAATWSELSVRFLVDVVTYNSKRPGSLWLPSPIFPCVRFLWPGTSDQSLLWLLSSLSQTPALIEPVHVTNEISAAFKAADFNTQLSVNLSSKGMNLLD